MFIPHAQSSCFFFLLLRVRTHTFPAHKPELAGPEAPKLDAAADKMPKFNQQFVRRGSQRASIRAFSWDCSVFRDVNTKSLFLCFSPEWKKLFHPTRQESLISCSNTQLFFFFSPTEPKRVPHHAWMKTSTWSDMRTGSDYGPTTPPVSTTVQETNQSVPNPRWWYTHAGYFQQTPCASACFQSSVCADAPPFVGNMSNKLNNCTADTRSGSQTWMKGLERKTKNTAPTQTEKVQQGSEGNGRITAMFTWF